LSDFEKTDARRHCGYPAYGASPAGFENWRFYGVFGLMEFRLNNLSPSELTVMRRYLTTLSGLEQAVPRSGDSMDTDQAAVWTRNKDEHRDRADLLDNWRRRLCGFLGIPPGPALGSGSMTLVV
jgi:hypothetical protein